MRIATPRQHHYVQARYLDGFLESNDTMLWVYGRNRPRPHRAVPDQVARQRDFYAKPNATAGENAEHFLERSVEAPGLAAVRQLVCSRASPTPSERLAIARYIAFQEWRVPYSRDLYREQAATFITHLLTGFEQSGKSAVVIQQSAGRDELYAGPPSLITRLEAEEYAKNISENPSSHDLEGMISLAETQTDWYLRMEWTVLHSPPKARFISSDNPVFKYFTGSGIDEAVVRPDCHICCPLSADALLVLRNPVPLRYTSFRILSDIPTEVTFRTVKKKSVANFNRRIAQNSHRWCFSGTQQDWLTVALQRKSLLPRPYLTETEYGMRFED